MKAIDTGRVIMCSSPLCNRSVDRDSNRVGWFGKSHAFYSSIIVAQYLFRSTEFSIFDRTVENDTTTINQSTENVYMVCINVYVLAGLSSLVQ